jgi:ABC-type nitrate/sulfonate/bicarbonate transport system ATPase subunit
MTSIVLDNLSFGYAGAPPIFKDLTIRLDGTSLPESGRIVTIVGPSGSGKTTLLRLVSSVERPQRGSLSLAPSNASVSYLQQEPVLFEHLSRRDNARYFTLVQRTRSQFDEPTFQRLLTKLKLTDVLNDGGGTDEMSGGERQRLSLLRALSIRPRILLLDEPCSGLDISVKLSFLQMLREVVDDFELLALYVTHHYEEAELVGDDLLYLTPRDRGQGVAAELFSIEEALAHPPSIEAAQASMNPGGNVIPCSIERSGVVTSPIGVVLGEVSDWELSEGQYVLVVPPESVGWVDGGELRVQPVGKSARYWFVQMSEHDKLVGPRTEFLPTSFYLNGPVVAFRDGEGTGIRVSVSGRASPSGKD